MDKGIMSNASDANKKTLAEQKVELKDVKQEVLGADMESKETLKAKSKETVEKPEASKDSKTVEKAKAAEAEQSAEKLKTVPKAKAADKEKTAETGKEPVVQIKETPKKTAPKKSSSKKAAKPVAEKGTKLKKVVKQNEKAAKKKMPQMIVSTYIQYLGKEIGESEIIQRVKQDWIGKGNEEVSIKNLELYVKPEESAVYYVVNGMLDSGKITF